MKKAMAARAAAQASVDSVRRPSVDQPKDANDTTDPITPAPPSSTPDSSANNASAITLPSNLNISDPNSHPRAAWEHVDEILQTLKTTFPLLMLSLETMVDQVHHKFKPTPEEEVYRSICMLLSDAIQVFHHIYES